MSQILILLSLLVPGWIGCSRDHQAVRFEPAPTEGFHWPYFLLLPDAASRIENAPLLVVPNNTGKVSDDAELHIEEAARDASGGSRFGRLALDLGIPLLVPGFPRPAEHSHFYTHALDRDSLTREVEGLGRLDLQLLAMIDNAREVAAAENWTLRPQVLIAGFSASGMFANRFTLLHPERVLAAAVGSPGGWPMVPSESWEGHCLTYPVGSCDLETLVGPGLKLDALQRTPMFFFLGADDENDSVPYSDSFDETERNQVLELFGETLSERWEVAEKIYAETTGNAQFKLYPETGHQVSTEMMEDLKHFFERVVQPPPKASGPFTEH